MEKPLVFWQESTLVEKNKRVAIVGPQNTRFRPGVLVTGYWLGSQARS